MTVLILAVTAFAFAAALVAACAHLIRLTRDLRDTDELVTALSDDKGDLWQQVMDLHTALGHAGDAMADLDAQLTRARAERDTAHAQAVKAGTTTVRLLEECDQQKTEHGSVLAARDAELALAAAAFIALATAVFCGPRALVAADRPPMPQLLPGGDYLVHDADGRGLILQTGDSDDVDLVGVGLPVGTNGTRPSGEVRP